MTRKIQLLLLLAGGLAPMVASAVDPVESVPIGEPVERHLSDYQPFGT